MAHWGAGMPMTHRDYGVIAKCPHCDKTDIVRKTMRQITCGSSTCQTKRTNARAKDRVTVNLGCSGSIPDTPGD